jgi:cobalt-zinc-cadmium efflux system protein
VGGDGRGHGPAPGHRWAHGHGHAHGHGLVRPGTRHRSRLAWSFALILGYFFVEAAAGLLTGSLALLSDAAHMLSDVGGLGMALAAIQLADRAERRGLDRGGRTFGLYRLEILAAFVNALVLAGVAGFVLVDAVRRLADPPEVAAGPMLAVAAVGLVVNGVALGLLRPGAAESLNVQAASLEVLADTLGSVGVVVAGAVLAATGWPYADPLVAAAIGLFVLPRTWRLGGQAVRILIQAAPPHLDPAGLRRELAALPGVVDVHDLHVWTLTSEMEVASAHLMVGVQADPHGVLDQARALLRDRHGIDHATLQVEPQDHLGCHELRW